MLSIMLLCRRITISTNYHPTIKIRSPIIHNSKCSIQPATANDTFGNIPMLLIVGIYCVWMIYSTSMNLDTDSKARTFLRSSKCLHEVIYDQLIQLLHFLNYFRVHQVSGFFYKSAFFTGIICIQHCPYPVV